MRILGKGPRFWEFSFSLQGPFRRRQGILEWGQEAEKELQKKLPALLNPPRLLPSEFRILLDEAILTCEFLERDRDYGNSGEMKFLFFFRDPLEDVKGFWNVVEKELQAYNHAPALLNHCLLNPPRLHPSEFRILQKATSWLISSIYPVLKTFQIPVKSDMSGSY